MIDFFQAMFKYNYDRLDFLHIQAYVFKENSGECVAFLVNNDLTQDVRVLFQDISFDLPHKSISILPDCKTITFNTAKVRPKYTF